MLGLLRQGFKMHQTDLSLAAILLLQPPKCLYSRHMPQCPVSRCLEGATDRQEMCWAAIL